MKEASSMIKLNGKVSIIMPGYNEGDQIYPNLVETDRVLSGMFADYEILFVNDGSKDNTLEMALKAERNCSRVRVINYTANHGKGHALKEGTAAARGKYIVFMDSDLDLPPSQLSHFFEIMFEKDADVVIGSKLHPESVSNYPLARKIISYGYYVFLLVLFRLNTHDTQTGLKLFKADVIKPVMTRILVKRFAYDIEVLSIINKLGYKIEESPVVLNFNRGPKWGRIKLNDVWYIFIDTLAIFYRLNILHYYEQ
ncbi:MAG: glycosyltransferase [Candidatus Helarchaeota archaeon]